MGTGTGKVVRVLRKRLADSQGASIEFENAGTDLSATDDDTMSTSCQYRGRRPLSTKQFLPSLPPQAKS